MQSRLEVLRIWLVAILAGLVGVGLALILLPAPDFCLSLCIF